MSSPSHLSPPPTKGHLSVARLANYWYAACRSVALGSHPMAVTVLGIPLVLFREPGGRARALLDRCPHRNVPLSLGRVKPSGYLECAYHGWQFRGDGQCMNVPGLVADENPRAWAAPTHAVRERDGLVWVYATPDVEPETEPFRVDVDAADGYQHVVREVEAEATLHAAIENALDVPHTAYLHRGLFRGGRKNEITAVVTRFSDRVITEYRGEPRPPGVVARILSPSGGIVEHWDRFFLPSIAQVEYRLGSENHFLVTSMCTPVSDTSTKLFAVVYFKTRFPGRLVRPILEPFAQRIFQQDAKILKSQTETIHRFGGEQFINTELDLMGPHIWRLLKQSERGPIADDAEPVMREVRFFA